MGRPGRPRTSPDHMADKACENLIPYEIDRLANPNLQFNVQGGRPRTNDIAELSKTIVDQKETILKRAYNLIVTSVASTIPMHCTAECPHAENCIIEEECRPYNMDDPHPEYGFKCPIEYNLFYTMFYAYLAELDIDSASSLEVQTAATLAGIQVKKRRVEDLINNDGMMVEQVASIDRNTGLPILTKCEHPMLATLDRLEKREDVIKKQFFATRQQIESKRKESLSSERKTVAEFLSSLAVSDRANSSKG